MKTTFIERLTQNIQSSISQQPLIGSSSYFKLTVRVPIQNQKLLEMKTFFIGRWPQNIKISISQQPLIGSSLNFKIMLSVPNQS